MSTESREPAGRRRLRILLVRPEGAATPAGSAPCTAETLAADGHIVTEVSGGENAARLLRTRPVNLVLVELCGASEALLEVAANLRGASGRVSARYTPIFLLSKTQSLSPPWPAYIDGVLSAPLQSDALVAAYLEFLSNSLSGDKRCTASNTCSEPDKAIDRLGGDLELYKDLVGRFLQDTYGVRRQIEVAVERRDANLLKTAAHSLKGFAASIGATTVSVVLGELEALGHSGDLSNLAPVWQKFRSEIERAAEELAAYYRPAACATMSER